MSQVIQRIADAICRAGKASLDQQRLALHLPLNRAMLCIDCDSVFEYGPQHCPACARGAVVPLATYVEGMSRRRIEL
jgi:hypothetical protein